MLYSFPDIVPFHYVRKSVAAYPALAPAPLLYRAKIKLHGSNSGVQVTANSVVAQSRNAVLGVGRAEGMGFSDWVADNREVFLRMHHGEDFCIFGEWCGPGVMKKAAISKIPSRIWAPFMIRYGADDATARVVVEPDAIWQIVGEHRDIIVLDWSTVPLMIDWRDVDSLQEVADFANKFVGEIEQRDPFVFERFGIEGIGEGLVFYPIGITSLDRISRLMFKAKGEHHKVVRSRAAVELDPVAVASTAEFVALFVTEPRLEQGLGAIGGVANKRQIGPFLAWLAADVRKESAHELAAAGLIWKGGVDHAVKAAAKAWFLQQAVTSAPSRSSSGCY